MKIRAESQHRRSLLHHRLMMVRLCQRLPFRPRSGHYQRVQLHIAHSRRPRSLSGQGRNHLLRHFLPFVFAYASSILEFSHDKTFSQKYKTFHSTDTFRRDKFGQNNSTHIPGRHQTATTFRKAIGLKITVQIAGSGSVAYPPHPVQQNSIRINH